MKFIKPIGISILVLSLSSVSCNNEWTQEKKVQFKKECAEKTTFKVQPICFEGFEFSEIENIKVVEKNGKDVINTFDFKLDKEEAKKDKKWLSINQEWSIKHTYEFQLGEREVYVLKDIQMAMNPEYTMSGENYGCNLESFSINGVKYSEVGNIIFSKNK